MAKRSKKEAIDFYESQTESKRDELQAKFGNEGVADRETKFYEWLQNYNDSDKVIQHFQDEEDRGDSHDGGIKHFSDW